MMEIVSRATTCGGSPTSARCLSTGSASVKAEYDEDGKRVHVLRRMRTIAGSSQAIQALFPFFAEVPEADGIVLDFYTWNQDPLARRGATQSEIRAIINSLGSPALFVALWWPLPAPDSDPGWVACNTSPTNLRDGAIRR